ncbi:MAG TPA: VOC family protein [Propionibacteriaceae bacterium]|nr:VOC family protein [Propionibacteriaceae bacterium]
MDILRTNIVLDAPDLDAESTFWAAMYGGTVEKDWDWHDVRVDGRTVLGIQLAPNHVRPQWPGGDQQQQLHLDLHVADIVAADAEARGFGAEVVQEADLAAPSGFIVYTDPAGHPFCLCWG